MRTRFEWGLLTDVQPPDLETRIAILRKKAPGPQSVPDDVLEYIATKFGTNIRELEASSGCTASRDLNARPSTFRWRRSSSRTSCPTRRPTR